MKESTLKPMTWQPIRLIRYAGMSMILALAGLITMACGDPWDFRDALDLIVAMDGYGGSFARLYSTPTDDQFNDVTIHEDVLVVVGSTFGEDSLDAVILRLRNDGSVVNQQRYTQGVPGVDEVFSTMDVAYRGGTDDLIIVGGYRDESDKTEGMLLQFQTTGQGTALVAGTTIETQHITTPANDADDEITGVAAGAAGAMAVGIAAPPSADRYGIYAHVGYENGVADYVKLVSAGIDLVFNDVATSDGDTYVAVGGVNGTTGDIVVAAIDGASGNIMPTGTASDATATIIDVNGGADLANAIGAMSDPGRFVIVGSTNTYFGGKDAWLIIVLSWDDGSELFALEAAYAVQLSEESGAAHAVYGVDDDDSFNYWGETDLFAVTGDRHASILMDATGEVIWAVAPGDTTRVLNGHASAIWPFNNTFGGFVVVGTNNQLGTDPRGTDGTILWALPDSGTSYPETSSTERDESDMVRDVTADVTLTPTIVQVTTTAGSLLAVSSEITSFPNGAVESLEILAQ